MPNPPETSCHDPRPADPSQLPTAREPGRRRRAMILLLLAAIAAAVAGAEPPSDGEAALRRRFGADCSAAELRIGRIDIEPLEIFDPQDPAESWTACRWANNLHRTTRPRAIENLLLFRSGEAYSARRLRESERALRAQRVFADATVEVVGCHDGGVDVRIVTHATWTLGGGVGFGRAGGTSNTRLEVSDSWLVSTHRSF